MLALLDPWQADASTWTRSESSGEVAHCGLGECRIEVVAVYYVGDGG